MQSTRTVGAIGSGDPGGFKELKLILPTKYKASMKDNDINLGDYEGRVTYSSHYLCIRERELWSESDRSRTLLLTA